MKKQKNVVTLNFYAGGFAEIVSKPSKLTYSFFKSWFTGNKSVGKAMNLLGLPFEKNDLPILELTDGELLINLINEEKTLYQNTIFSYEKQSSYFDNPKLKINWLKAFNFYCLYNTLRIIITQAKWIAFPDKTINTARKFLHLIPAAVISSDKIDQIIYEYVFPSVIAIGFLAEFFEHLLKNEVGENYLVIEKYISSKIIKEDWFFHSIYDQIKVKSGEMSFNDYLHLYGIRADKDYELNSPRWHEIPEVIKRRIKKVNEIKINENHEQKLEPKFNRFNKLIQTVISLRLLRSEAKKKTLIPFDKLRQLCIRKQLLINYQDNEKNNLRQKNSLSVKSNTGTPVSVGTAKGIAQIIRNSQTIIHKNSVGIFPNASPEFAVQYPQCQGMIFLQGGQTSHGAIVAREFGIPALIDNQAASIKEGVEIYINGEKGFWTTT